MVDKRFKETLEQKLKSEISKLEDLQKSDLNGKRISVNFATIMQSRLNELTKISDSQVLLSSAISLLRSTVNILDDTISSVNKTRREQKGRVSSLNEYYSNFLEIEKKIDEEVIPLVEKEEIEQSSQDENLKNESIRKIGERPEKLKSIRNSNYSE